jgi:hypothetical protein
MIGFDLQEHGVPAFGVFANDEAYKSSGDTTF